MDGYKACCWAAIGLAALLVVGCSAQQRSQGCPADTTCLQYGNGAEPESLDPAKALGTWEGRIIDQLSEGLTKRGADGVVGPGLARSWSVSSDGLTWTFILERRHWSDGTPLTGEDVVYSVRRTLAPETAAQGAFMLYPILNAKAVNSGAAPAQALGMSSPVPDRVVIRLEHPWPVLPVYAAHRVMRPVPKHIVERQGSGWIRPGAYVGNGPYTLVSWKLGDRIVLRKNPSYEGEPGCSDAINFYPTNDLVTAERQVKANELDVSIGIQSNRVRYLRQPGKMPGYVRVAPTTGLSYLALNIHDVPALRDVRVRRALSLAVDRDFITEKLLVGGQTPAYGFLPPGLEDYPAGGRKDSELARPFSDRQREARRLLSEAGYSQARPLRLTMKHRNSSDPMVFAPALQADWAAVGVRVKLEQNETQVAYAAYEVGDFEIADAGWTSFDALNFLDLLRSTTGGQNYGGYANPDYDALLVRAEAASDARVRQASIRAAEQLLLADAAVIPLFYLSARNLVRPDLKGWVDNSIDVHPASKLCLPAHNAALTGGREN